MMSLRTHANQKLSVLLLALLGMSSMLFNSGCTRNPLDAFFKKTSTQSQPSCGFLQNVYGERVSWKNKLPIRLYIHESVPRNMLPGIYRAIQKWEQLANRKLFEVAQENFKDSKGARQDGLNVIYWLTE